MICWKSCSGRNKNMLFGKSASNLEVPRTDQNRNKWAPDRSKITLLKKHNTSWISENFANTRTLNNYAIAVVKQRIYVFGLILGGQKSWTIMTFRTHGNVDFVLYFKAYLSNQGDQKSIKNECQKLEQLLKIKHAKTENVWNLEFSRDPSLAKSGMRDGPGERFFLRIR